MALTSIALATLLFSSPAHQEAKVNFDQAVAWKWLMKQCDMGPRKAGTKPQVDCRDMILAETKKNCDKAELQEFSHTWSRDNKKYTMWNVIGYQNWEKATTRVVLLTHWDTRPTADQEEDEANRSKPILGANDGASGTAVLLELMRHTKNVPKSLASATSSSMAKTSDQDSTKCSLAPSNSPSTHRLPNPTTESSST